MKTVFIVVTVLNGYKNVYNAYATAEAAKAAIEDLKSRWNYCTHEFYYMEMPIIGE